MRRMKRINRKSAYFLRHSMALKPRGYTERSVVGYKEDHLIYNNTLSLHFGEHFFLLESWSRTLRLRYENTKYRNVRTNITLICRLDLSFQLIHRIIHRKLLSIPDTSWYRSRARLTDSIVPLLLVLFTRTHQTACPFFLSQAVHIQHQERERDTYTHTHNPFSLLFLTRANSFFLHYPLTLVNDNQRWVQFVHDNHTDIIDCQIIAHTWSWYWTHVYSADRATEFWLITLSWKTEGASHVAHYCPAIVWYSCSVVQRSSLSRRVISLLFSLFLPAAERSRVSARTERMLSVEEIREMRRERSDPYGGE